MRPCGVQCIQRGLKYTEHKPFGRHYLGVTRNKMSSAVHTLTPSFPSRGPIDPTCSQCTLFVQGYPRVLSLHAIHI